MSHIFISYIHEDQKIVNKIVGILQSNGLEVWIDRSNILPGRRWKDSIREAIQSGAYFVACFSDSYSRRTKSYMNEELAVAIDELRQYAHDRPWFIPILLSDCDVPAMSVGGGQTLLDFQWIDLYSDFSLGIQNLLKALSFEEINHIKSLIDDFGYSYTRRLGDQSYGSPDTPKKVYIESVKELAEKYGVIYDPLKLKK